MRPITELSEMQELQLRIARNIHSFCQEQGIRYYLSHGSLIGAIRHNGFIPWDDDIDLFMPRQDYEKFCNIFPKYQNKYGLTLANSETTVYYGRPMSKVFLNDTVLTEPQFKGDDQIGVNVDLWPLDGVPKHFKKFWTQYIHFLVITYYGTILKYEYCRSIGQKIKHFLTLPINSRKLLGHIIKQMKRYKFETAETVTCYTDPYYALMKRDWFSGIISREFEDEQFFIPSGYDEILHSIYGDYMKLPPPEKQVPHHIINTYMKE